jgi:hypothetical protein
LEICKLKENKGNLENAAHEHVIALVSDFVLREHLVHHGDEDVVFLAQLHNQSSEGIHGDMPQLWHGIQHSHDGVDNTRSIIGQVQGVSQSVYGFQSSPDIDQ